MIFVSIDFETLVPFSTEWWTCAVAVAEYPSGNIIETTSFAVERSLDSPPNQFWQRHHHAYRFNVMLSKGRTDVSEEEERIATYFDSIRARFTDFTFLTDCPEADTGMLNHILRRRGRPVISDRGEGLFRQTVCTWSMRLGMKRCLGPYKWFALLQSSAAEAASRPVELACIGTLVHVAHTDCLVMLRNYFRLMDIQAKTNGSALVVQQPPSIGVQP